MVTCSQCGKSFKTDFGLKIHTTKIHTTVSRQGMGPISPEFINQLDTNHCPTCQFFATIAIQAINELVKKI